MSTAAKQQKVILFTIDVESHNPGYDENGALWIGDLLYKRDITGTFFVVGEVAERRPDLLHSLLSQGHEIASHGYSHRGYYRGYDQPYLDESAEEKIREELKYSFNCIRSLGIQVCGYRAPRFRIRPNQLDIVGEFFEYDSSFRSHCISNEILRKASKSRVSEFPVSSFHPLPVNMGTPALLLGGIRLWRLLERISRFSVPLVFYCHSFDVVAGGASRHPGPNWLKRSLYYRHCGKRGREFLEDLLPYLLDGGWKFMTCSQYLRVHEKNNSQI